MSTETQTPPRPGQPGYKPTEEQLRKMREGRENSKTRKREAAARREAARSGAQGRAPDRAAGPISAGMRKKIIEYVIEPFIQIVEFGALYGARHLTGPAIPLDDQGQPAITQVQYVALVKTHRKSAFSDDKLAQWERRYVAEELTNELVRWPRVLRVLIALAEIMERGGLPAALAIVAAPRMLRHGAFPEELGELVLAMHEAARKAHGGKPEAARPSPDGSTGPEEVAPTEPLSVG